MKDRLRVGLLLAAVALVYSNTLLNEFTMDDGLYVANNPQVTVPSVRALFTPKQDQQRSFDRSRSLRWH